MTTQLRKIIFSLPKRRPTRAVKDEAELFHVTDWPMHYLLAIDRHHVQNMARVLQPLDCSPLMWRVLSILADQDGHNVSELAELSVIERSNLSKLLDGMERDGLIARTAPDGDKRKTLIFLADSGRDLFARSLPVVLRYYASFLTGISPSEMTAFMKVLTRIKSNVKTFDPRDVHGKD
ncbi:MarR family winged helix-turn-helix transcriptional regulator [Pigmentiphaga litoralis]|uniref:DNA-binding MarR family transcriptional regulator n=1 Tax=Pigmentiphaga litoralis TaxID=516702 RepID=A0A7Y9LK11_9BURK|nr:MarR family transcriptional regulator [Pigmentiphaga litoralis]NYE23872.1 DNA-binding MarR family transcriptional regulator [Pigmentiphaga litoralis]NYE82514.1 DNA-binding MarR family transcriptional regulator [Pigmentiphaga litoralis]